VPARRLSIVALLVAVMPLFAACTRTSTDDGLERRAVYVAIGASDTVGVGARDPRRDAWPAVFAQTALPPTAQVHNLGISGATTAEAIRRELPRALALRPTIATVWLNVNDLTSAVPPSTYGDRLRQLLARLRRGGRTEVLVATTPRLDSLPAYRACVDGSEACAIGPFVPPPSLLRFAVDAYNDAIRAAAEDTGAILVDLHALGDVPARHPDWVSGDGFHPSTEGYRHVAEAFARALARA
jgi:acyl-CoA thioesterase I